MSVVMNSCIFYGYEVSEKAAQLIKEGALPEDWEEQVDHCVDLLWDCLRGEFLYVGVLLHSADGFSNGEVYEIPETLTNDELYFNMQVRQNEMLRLIIGDLKPKLYHIVYWS